MVGWSPVRHSCPELCRADDPMSFFAYPSRGNRCWKTDPISRVTADYQARMCLTARHRHCPVFEAQGVSARAMAARPVHSTERRKRASAIGWKWARWAIPIAAVLGTGVWFVFQALEGGGELPLPSPTVSPTKAIATTSAAAEPASTPSARPRAWESARRATLTATQSRTPTPTPTLTPTPGPGLETPIGPQGVLLIHRVVEGETLESLAAVFQTTPETIRAVNVWSDMALQAGQLIVIPVQIIDPTGLQRFLAWQVPPEGRLVAEVAELYSTDEDRIRIVNHLGDSAFVPGGRWLIIPIVQP